MPCITGIDLVARVRTGAQAPGLPIIMVTSRDTADDIVAGLAAGADDYVAKPVVGGVLRARVAVLLRRTAPPLDQAIEVFGDVTLDSGRYAVIRRGEDNVLTQNRRCERGRNGGHHGRWRGNGKRSFHQHRRGC